MKRSQKNIPAYLKSRDISYKQPLCLAPSENMLFQPDGHVFSCHYNRIFIGKYPEQSIQDIWHGKERKQLAKMLKNHNFGPGCYACKDHIDNRLFHLANCKKYDYLDTNNNHSPQQMEFQLDNTCNMGCMVCSGEYSSLIRKNREKLPPLHIPYDEHFVEELKAFIPRLKYANFSGGEPFLNSLYYSIWENISHINPKINIAISTNGSIWNDKTEKLFSNLNTHLDISIDSLDPETYNKNRKNGDFKTVFQNTERIMELSRVKNNISLSVKFLIMPLNLKSIPELFNYYNDRDVVLNPKFVYHPVLASMQMLPKAEIQKSVQILEQVKPQIKTETITQQKNFKKYKDIITQLEMWANVSKYHLMNEYSKMSTDILIIKFRNQIEAYCNQQYKREARQRVIRQSNDGFDYLLEHSPNTNALKQGIVGFLLLPPGLIINELQNGASETLLSRFLQNAELHIDKLSIDDPSLTYKNASNNGNQ
ncbi:MAG: radical SAM protein [Bacteroidota bacterium]